MSAVKLILASGSPRRREILSAAGAVFDVITSDADEKLPAGTNPADAVVILASRKASAVYNSRPDFSGEDVFVLGSDTVVDIDGRILGKPSDKDEARSMISAISGGSHLVHTGICVIHNGISSGISETTRVSVDSLTPEEIEAYIESGEPYDKAGGYAIQGLFSKYIAGIRGDYYNVMGLPVRALERLLKSSFGVSLRDFT